MTGDDVSKRLRQRPGDHRRFDVHEVGRTGEDEAFGMRQVRQQETRSRRAVVRGFRFRRRRRRARDEGCAVLWFRRTTSRAGPCPAHRSPRPQPPAPMRPGNPPRRLPPRHRGTDPRSDGARRGIPRRWSQRRAPAPAVRATGPPRSRPAPDEGRCCRPGSARRRVLCPVDPGSPEEAPRVGNLVADGAGPGYRAAASVAAPVVCHQPVPAERRLRHQRLEGIRDERPVDAGHRLPGAHVEAGERDSLSLGPLHDPTPTPPWVPRHQRSGQGSPARRTRGSTWCPR